MKDWLIKALNLSGEETPFPWQEELLRSFLRGTIPPAIDIPTGLGKTAVMAIWLVARASGAKLPRRLVYVVDRRAVVDQATTEAQRLREWVEKDADAKLGLGLARPLPISTLRGQHVDNREWIEDPSAPAIVVGTVDMIGSRLLFEGYGVSRKMRPYHAALLGVDTLVVLDEAHLVPPFERLLDVIARDVEGFGPREPTLRASVPRFRLLSLSATGREVDCALRLTSADLEHVVVRRRLDAPKRLRVRRLDAGADLATALAEEAWQVTENGTAAVRCIVFCDKREDAQHAEELTEKRKKGDRKAGIAPVDLRTDLFVGGRRVFEREAAAHRLGELGFLAGGRQKARVPVFLFATSAAEVGVDLDADHMVSDVVAWERMVQRLGRVNRRGSGDARVVLIAEAPRPPTKIEHKALGTPEPDRTTKHMESVAKYERDVAFTHACMRALDALPSQDGTVDVSPGALRRAKQDERFAAVLRAATTAEPLRPGLSRALVDAWSMTSLEEHTGRPEIQPWLRGWVDEKPQTSIVWRRYLPVRGDGSLGKKSDVEGFFEAAPPHAIETLETETYRAVAWLMARAGAAAQRAGASNGVKGVDPAIRLRVSDVAVIALTRAGELRERRRGDHRWRLADLLEEQALEEVLRTASPEERARVTDARGKDDAARREKTKDTLERLAAGATLVVDRRLGGLGATGLLDEEVDELPSTVDDDARSLSPVDQGVPRVRFRVWSTADAPPDSDDSWLPRFRFAVHEPEDGDGTSLVVDKWRQDAATEEDRSASRRPQLLDEHQSWAEKQARSLAAGLGLDEYVEMLAVAARLHDEGKRAKRWQRAFNALPDGTYAKTRGPINYDLLDGYRHELGSLLHAVNEERLRALGDEQRELALHLIAAHHGFARPVIRTTGCDATPPSALEATAGEIALRFARLQKRWGPWGLAWWESLLRAADHQASRSNDK